MVHGTMGEAFRRACRCLWVAAVMLATSLAAAQESAPAPRVEKPPARSLDRPREFRLGNGLRFLVQRDARQPIFAFLVSYEVGNRDDPPGYDGLAHLVEHLTFRGSRHLGPYQGLRELEKVGALDKNGVTMADNTAYYAVLPAQYLPLAFWVESERMGFTLERFSNESLSLEAATIRKELLERHHPGELELTLSSRLFSEGNSYRLTEQPDAHAAGLSDVQWFFQAGYRPDKATVVIVGDVDPVLVESLARKYFGPITNPPISLARKPIPPRVFPGRERLTISRLVGTRRLIMVWPTPVPGSKDDLTLRVACEIMRFGRASVGAALAKLGVAEGASVRLSRNDGAGFLFVEADFHFGSQYAATEYAIERYMWGLAEEPLPSAALDAARDAVKRQLLRDSEDPLDHAWLHLDALRHGGRSFQLSTTLTRLDAITSASVAELARRYWSPYRRLSTWYGDLRSEPTVPLGDYIQYEVFR